MLILDSTIQAASNQQLSSALWWEMVLRYAGTAGLSALVSWALATIQFGKKLRGHEERMLTAIRDQGVDANDKIDEVRRELDRVKAEVWGPQGESGLRKDVVTIQQTIQQQQITLAEILTKVTMLVKNV